MVQLELPILTHNSICNRVGGKFAPEATKLFAISAPIALVTKIHNFIPFYVKHVLEK